METFRVRLEVDLEVEAYNRGDAEDLARDTIYEMEGLGVSIIGVNPHEQLGD